MPVYAYSCERCGAHFERMQRFNDDPISICPECEHQTVRRVIQPAGIIFKGSGWYVKDSKTSNSAGQPGKQDGESSKDSKVEKTDSSKTSTEKSKQDGSKESTNKNSDAGDNVKAS